MSALKFTAFGDFADAAEVEAWCRENDKLTAYNERIRAFADFIIAAVIDDLVDDTGKETASPVARLRFRADLAKALSDFHRSSPS